MIEKSFVCPMCGATRYSDLVPYKVENKARAFLDKSLVKCAECRTMSIYPAPLEEELNEYYNTYWESQDIDKLMALFVSQAEARFKYMRNHVKPVGNVIKILDIGAGYGLIKKEFERGFPNHEIIYDAVELDPSAVSYLKEKIKARNIYAKLEETDEKYSVIVLAHILEHFADPLDYLKQLGKYLDEAGIIFIEIPNQDYLYKSSNEPHLISCNPESLGILAKRAGYHVLGLNTCGRKIKHHMKRLAKSTTIAGLPENHRLRLKYKKRKKRMKTRDFQKLIVSSHRYGQNRHWIRMVVVEK